MQPTTRAATALSLALSLCLTLFTGCGITYRKLAPGTDAKPAKCEPGKQGGTLRLALAFGPLTFNPFVDSTPDTLAVLRKLYGTLLDYDFEKQVVEDSGLATAVSLIDDGKTYRVTLRKCFFSDGSPLVPDDVVFSYEQALKAGSALSDLLKTGVGNERGEARFSIVDAQTVEIQFNDAISADAAKFVFARIPIVSKTNFPTVADDPTKIACSGPFVVKSFSPNKELRLAANPNYWKVDNAGTVLPYLNEVIYELGVDRKTQSERFAEGKYDIVDYLLPTQVKAAEGQVKVHNAGGSLRVWTLVGNTRLDQTKVDRNRSKHFLNDDFREALSRLIDRKRLASAVLDGHADPCFGLIAPGNTTWYDPNAPRYESNVEIAKAALQSAGYTYRNGKLIDGIGLPVRFKLVVPKEPTAIALGQAIVQDLTSGGLDIVLDEQPMEKWWKLLTTGIFDMILVELQPELPDPIFLQPFVTGSRPYFAEPVITNVQTDLRGYDWFKKIAKDFDQALRQKTVEERRKLYYDFQRRWNEVSPVVHLISEHTIAGVRSNVLNVRLAKFDPAATWNLEELYLK
jgi:Bacterial extracellular solute-binding proteins, family 5 Middle.